MIVKIQISKMHSIQLKQWLKRSFSFKHICQERGNVHPKGKKKKKSKVNPK